MSLENSNSAQIELNQTRGFSPLRQSLKDFGEVSKGADVQILRAEAQKIIDLARGEIFNSLNYRLSEAQIRYFREILKTLRIFAGNRLHIPDYSELINNQASCEVTLNVGDEVKLD